MLKRIPRFYSRTFWRYEQFGHYRFKAFDQQYALLRISLRNRQKFSCDEMDYH